MSMPNCLCINLYKDMYVHMHIMYACIHVCMYVCLYVRRYIYIYLYIYIYMYIYVRVCVHVRQGNTGLNSSDTDKMYSRTRCTDTQVLQQEPREVLPLFFDRM